jgi:hypothetical protein
MKKILLTALSLLAVNLIDDAYENRNIDPKNPCSWCWFSIQQCNQKFLFDQMTSNMNILEC